jgi:arylsulfatase A-like enzyme
MMLALAGAQWACRGAKAPGDQPREQAHVRDLLASLERAEWQSDTLALWMLRPSLEFDVGGWKVEEASFRSRQRIARVPLRFVTTDEKELQLALRAGGSAGRLLRVGVRLNARPLRALQLHEEERFALTLPASAQRPGRNDLEFVLEEPKRRSGQRALVLSGLEVGPRGAPAARETAQGLQLPPGATLSFFLRVGKGARLEAQAEAEAGPLAVRIALDRGDGPSTLARLLSEERGTSGFELGLDTPPGTIAAISLTEHAGSGARLKQLRVTQPADAPTPSARLQERPDVVLFLVDALAARVLGAYGGPARSPSFDAFAAQGILFTDASAQSSWTMPSVAALFTGLEPDRLGVYGPWGDLPDSSDTLAERLSTLGYRTGGFVANALLTRARGYAQGFGVWLQEEARSTGRPAEEVVEEALRWLDAESGPSFAYVHVMEPHAPYGHGGAALHALAQKTSPTPAEVERLRAAYRVDVERADAAFGALLDGLRARGRLERSVVVVLADHGEEFFEHGGQGHGKTLYQEVVHIPLAARLPGARRAGVREPTPLQHADLLPTLLGLLGAPSPPVDGRDLSALWLLGRAPAPEVLASRLLFEKRTHDKVAARWGALKLIVNEEAGAARRLEMYDLAADPAEATDVLDRNAVVAGYLLGELRARRRSAVAGAPEERAPTSDPDALERLRALGYVR